VAGCQGAVLHGEALCILRRRGQFQMVGGRHFFGAPRTWNPSLFSPVNELGGRERVERGFAEKVT
jgi:hypothetical protein